MRIKYLTLNIWRGKLFDEIISFIKEEDPDIVALQEVYDGKDPELEKHFRSYTELKNILGYQYGSFSSAFLNVVLPPTPIEEGNAVFSKYPILSTVSTFYDVPYKRITEHDEKQFPFYPRLLQHVLIRVSEETVGTKGLLNVFNTHGIWGVDGKDNERRLRMSETIVKHVKDKPFAILSGDFNVNQGTRSIANIEKVMTNVFKDELSSTFNMKHKASNTGFASAVVDNIFISSDMKVIDHYMPDVNVSDHMPLVTLLEIV